VSASYGRVDDFEVIISVISAVSLGEGNTVTQSPMLPCVNIPTNSSQMSDSDGDQSKTAGRETSGPKRRYNQCVIYCDSQPTNKEPLFDALWQQVNRMEHAFTDEICDALIWAGD